MKFQQVPLLVLVIALLSACAGQSATQTTTVPTAPTAIAPSNTPDSLVEANTADTEPSPVEASSEANNEPRMIKHAMGETVVPAHPKRVVTLDMGELDAALALGIKPVGSVTIFDDGTFPAYLGDATEGIEPVGTIASPNLEKIAALKPDLILSSKTRDEERYELLSQIAPTVFAERLGDAWLDNFLLFADAMGEKEQGEAKVAAYKQRLADLNSKLKEQGEVPVVSMVRFMKGGQVRMYNNGSFIGTILTGAQLGRPEAQTVEDKVWSEVNKEILSSVDGDVIFYGIYGADDESSLADYEQDPLWQQLSAIKNNKIFRVDDDYWFTSIGLIAANLVIDDLEKHLLP